MSNNIVLMMHLISFDYMGQIITNFVSLVGRPWLLLFRGQKIWYSDLEIGFKIFCLSASLGRTGFRNSLRTQMDHIRQTRIMIEKIDYINNWLSLTKNWLYYTKNKNIYQLKLVILDENWLYQIKTDYIIHYLVYK